MPDFIRDGTGSGLLAKVEAGNRLKVASKTSFAEEIAAQNDRAFIFHGRCHLSANSSGGFMAIKNTSADVKIAISRIYIDAHSLTDDIIVEQVKNPTISGGTNISSTGIINKNYASSRAMTATLTISDVSSDMTFTGGSPYHAFPVQSLQQYGRDMKGTNLLGQNDILVFGWETVDGENAVDGEIISFSVNVYEIPVVEGE
jgi:hypothetical protein